MSEETKKLRDVLLRVRLAGPAVGELAFWSKTVIVERADRDLICDEFEKMLSEKEKN